MDKKRESVSLKIKTTIKIKIECVTFKPEGENSILVKGEEGGRYKERRINEKYKMSEISLNLSIITKN